MSQQYGLNPDEVLELPLFTLHLKHAVTAGARKRLSGQAKAVFDQ